MSKYEQERIDARRILITQLLEIDHISDEEIDREKKKDTSISFTLIRLSEQSRSERAFDEIHVKESDAANTNAAP